MLDAYRFYSPLWFAALPLVLGALWFAHQSRRQNAAVYSSLDGLRGLPVTLAQRVKRILPWVYGLGLVLMVAALARPQLGRSENRIYTEGIAIQMALDISGSMEARDFQLNGESDSRINAVKYVVRSFVTGEKDLDLSGRPNDLVGIVAFGGFADSKVPLTLDHGALIDIVNGLQVPKRIRDRRGNVINAETLGEDLATAIGDGLALSIDRLRNVKAKSKVLILLTDGDNNAGVVEPLEAAQIAKELGIRIYTIGVGQTGVAPIPIEDDYGNTFLDARRFRLDEELLRKIADIGGGKYFNAKNTEALAAVYAEIDRLEKSKVEETHFTEYTELYPWMALPGLGLIVLVSLLGATRFRTLP
jgi:Ca-activated chloride channel homolog